jgi:hypothetical protein
LALRLLPALISGSSLLLALPASAATWTENRTTPAVSELVAVDQTGEAAWLFGSEDIAGDGANAFGDAEQAADVRSAYAATRGKRLWLRMYVSARTAPTALKAFVFVDADDDVRTGGPARAPEIDSSLDADSSPGGYDDALAWTGTGLIGAWRWQAGNGMGNGNGNMGSYLALTDLEPLHAQTELGTDLDPLRLNAPQNGYVQLAVDLEPIHLGVRCEAQLLFRSISGNLRDRDVGSAGPCIPGDQDGNGVADVAEPDASCTSDEQCPADGKCTDGRCVAPDGVLAPDGALTPDGVLASGDVVQGGAFTCASARVPAGPTRWLGLGALSVALGLSRWRRRGRGTC